MAILRNSRGVLKTFPVQVNKFPVPLPREFGDKCLTLRPDFTDLSAACDAKDGLPGFIPVHREIGGSVAEILKALRGRADDDIALRLDLEHRKTALDQTVRGEAKQPVDTAEPVRV
jgi:hypothetical protein